LHWLIFNRILLYLDFLLFLNYCLLWTLLLLERVAAAFALDLDLKFILLFNLALQQLLIDLIFNKL